MKIGLENVSLSIGGKEILKNVTLMAGSDAPVILSGASGAGKTSLLRVLAGLQPPTQGRVVGITRETRVAVLYQENRLFSALSALDNLRLVSKNEEKIWALAREAGLTKEELLRSPDKLSGGEKRRISILRALLFEGDVYLLDEPTKGLDADTKTKVLALIKRETSGKPLLVITHDKEEAEVFPERVEKRLSGGVLVSL